MFFKKKSNIIFRHYESFGYITDNRNFGYKQKDDQGNIGDKIISESGAIFFSVLSRNPQSIEKLANKIKNQISEIDIRTIKKDAKDFYCILERDGFIVSGETMKKCDEKDTKHSFNNIKPASQKISSTILPTLKSTQEFFEEYYQGKHQLTNLHIEITSKCNERCIHCYIPHEYKINHINTGLFYKVLEECKNMRLLHLTISGGEPMLHNNFVDFLKKCREYDFSVNVLSNLTVLTGEIIREMKANPLLGVQVTVYSMDAEIHDEITLMKGSHEKTIKSISKLVENNIPVQVSCPILKQNKNCYNDVLNWAKRQGINAEEDSVIIARYNHSIENLSCRLSIDEIRNIISSKVANDPKYFEELLTEAEKNNNVKSNDFVCSVCTSSICVADNGDVYPCAGWQNYVVGNLKDSSLEDIWNNSEKVNYLRNLRKKVFPKCLQCLDKEYCTMCMVRNANENPHGDPLMVNEYFCDVVKVIKEIVLEIKMKR